MRRLFIAAVSCVVVAAIFFSACKPRKTDPAPTPDYGNFPDAIGRIIVDKCATAGCHNAASYKNSAGLLLDSWEHLF